MSRKKYPTLCLFCALYARQFVSGTLVTAQDAVSPAEARAIAKEAYIFGFAMVEGYHIQYAYFVDRDNPEFKAPWNQIRNIPRVFTPDDNVVQIPNSDTPYSTLGLDLRAEPIVITVPPIETSRYFSVQLIDLYTFNFGYIGSRTTGNDGGSFLIAGTRLERRSTAWRQESLSLRDRIRNRGVSHSAFQSRRPR